MNQTACGIPQSHPAADLAGGTPICPAVDGYRLSNGGRAAVHPVDAAGRGTSSLEPRSTTSSEPPKQSFVVFLRPMYGRTDSDRVSFLGVTNRSNLGGN